MAFADKVLVCSNCGSEFTFTAGEQEFYAAKGFTNEPRRCPTCRASRKTERGGYSSGETRYAGPRQMYPVTCANCGKATEVPFEPRQGRPVYCNDCFSQTRASARY